MQNSYLDWNTGVDNFVAVFVVDAAAVDDVVDDEAVDVAADVAAVVADGLGACCFSLISRRLPERVAALDSSTARQWYCPVSVTWSKAGSEFLGLTLAEHA